MLATTLLLLGLLSPLRWAALTPENVIPAKVLSFQYLTQAYCDLLHGASNGFRVAALPDTFSSSRYCACVKEAESAAKFCPYGNGPASLQAYCLQTVQGTLEGRPMSRRRKPIATFVRARRASQGCQDSRLFGKVISSGACATGQSLYRTADSQCRCEVNGQAPSNSKKCALPKAGGYATCRDSVEYFYQGTSSGVWVMGEQNRGPTMKCERRCNAGLHLSPSEKPVTCCTSGYRSIASGVCAQVYGWEAVTL